MESIENKEFKLWYYYLGNQLIKKQKPFAPGAQIHLHSMEGCYTVQFADVYGFYIIKNHKLIKKPWTDFHCLKNQGTSELTALKKIHKQVLSIADQFATVISAKANSLSYRH